MTTALLDAPAPDVERLSFSLSDTQFAFVDDPSRIVWLDGPGGEGKTYCAICALFRHYQRIIEWEKEHRPNEPILPMSVAIIRDSLMNLKRNTVKSIQRSFPRLFAFYGDCHQMLESGCTPDDLKTWLQWRKGPAPTWLDCELFGMDDMQSLDRIQGGEYDFIWIEEPAPILDTGNNGIRQEVFTICRTRIRGRALDASTAGPKRLQITMNPADEDHWTSKQIDARGSDAAYYRIRPGENKHLSEEDRVATREAYAGRPDLYKRFVKGERAKVYAGVAVVEEFNETLHMAREWLLPIPDVEVMRCWDGGLNPTCVLAQFTSSGHIHFLDCVMLERGGMAQLIETRLKAVLARPRYQRIKRWRDCGDASLKSPEQSNSDHSAAKIIEEALKTTYEPGVQDWGPRREALKHIFTMMPNGKPMVQINPRVTEGEPFNRLKAAFAGGYCYKVTPTGEILRDGPDKNRHSHPGDAVSHVVAHVYFRPKLDPPPKRNPLRLKRAAGYGVGG